MHLKFMCLFIFTVEVFEKETNYIENFIQSLLNVAIDLNDGNMLDT